MAHVNVSGNHILGCRMSTAIDSVVDQALGLTTSERFDVIEKLLASLDAPDASIDAIWGKEADARIAAYERGEMEVVSTYDVFGKYRKA